MVVGILLSFCIFRQTVALRSGVVDELRQRPRQSFEIGAVRGGISRLAVIPHRYADHAGPRRNHARYFYRCGSRIAWILAALDPFDALVEIQGGVAFFLIGNDAAEGLRPRLADRP